MILRQESLASPRTAARKTAFAESVERDVVKDEAPPREQIGDLARRVVHQDAEAVAAAASAIDDGFFATVRLLLACRGKTLVTGMGTSGATARRIAHLLSVGGTPALFVHAADGLHGGLGAVAADDAVIAISKGGESDELNEFVRRAKARGATVVAMTAAPGSTLAALADSRLIVQTPPESDFGGKIAMGSALANCAVGDALVAVLMTLRGYSWQSFDFSHPGGAVGKGIVDLGSEPGGGESGAR